MGKFISERLRKAREDAGMTQESFARSIGLSSEFISLLESGKRAPSLDTLSRVSSFFGRDPSFFLGEKEAAFKVLFRAPAVKLNQAARLELEHFQRYGEDYLRLEAATGRRLRTAPLYPASSGSSGPLSPERMAAEERRRLGLGDEPVRDIFSLLEKNGLRILRRPLSRDTGISGVFVFLEAQNAAFALINSAQTVCRQAFTAAHEYCHYLKDRYDAPRIDSLDLLEGEGAEAPKSAPPSPSRRRRQNGRGASRVDGKEAFAQEFAAHFLMPPAKIRELADRAPSYEVVLLLKRYFGVSAQAMLRTLLNLGFLSPARFEEFSALDPTAREREVFGSTDEDYGPGSGLDSGPAVVSDRYRLMEREVSGAKRTSRTQ